MIKVALYLIGTSLVWCGGVCFGAWMAIRGKRHENTGSRY